VAGFLLFVHTRLALAAILFAIVLGAWGTFQYVRHKALSGGFRSAYLMLCGLAAVQGLVGILQLLAGSKLHNPLHVVYGIFAVLFLPGLYFYSASGRASKARDAAFMTASCWIVLVAFGRGWITGQ
jgi:heme A synthase